MFGRLHARFLFGCTEGFVVNGILGSCFFDEMSDKIGKVFLCSEYSAAT